MNPFISIFLITNPYSVGVKGGIFFEKEGFFRPSFFIVEGRIFTDEIFSNLNIQYDSLSLFTKFNSLGVDIYLFKGNNFFVIEGAYKLISQVYFIHKEYEFMKVNTVIEGYYLCIYLGRAFKNIHISYGIGYSSILKKYLMSLQLGVNL